MPPFIFEFQQKLSAVHLKPGIPPPNLPDIPPKRSGEYPEDGNAYSAAPGTYPETCDTDSNRCDTSREHRGKHSVARKPYPAVPDTLFSRPGGQITPFNPHFSLRTALRRLASRC